MKAGKFVIAAMSLCILTAMADNRAEKRGAAELAALVPKALPSDVASPETIVEAVHRSISGPASSHFDFNRFRSLFLPNGNVGHAGVENRGEPPQIMYKAVTEWVAENQEARNPIELSENIISMRVSHFGNIASVFYTHDVNVNSRGKIISYRTTNIAQLVYDGTRWWVASLVWNVSPDPDALPAGMG